MSTDEIIIYQKSRAWESYEETLVLSNENHWNAFSNRLYYACFYIVSALLLSKGNKFNSHIGVKTEFHRSFVKDNIISKESGRTYNRLFNLRQEGDYVDFKRLTKEEIFPILQEVKNFITEVESLL